MGESSRVRVGFLVALLSLALSGCAVEELHWEEGVDRHGPASAYIIEGEEREAVDEPRQTSEELLRERNE